MIIVLATLICIIVSVFIGNLYVRSKKRNLNQTLLAQKVTKKIDEIKPVKALLFDEFKPSSYLNVAKSTGTKFISPVSLFDVLNKSTNDTLQADKKEIKKESTSHFDTMGPSINFADYQIFYDSVYQDLGQSKPKSPLTRAQLINRQRQYHTPLRKSRCHHWPNCTNNNCKYFHPKRECRNGNYCSFADKCIFIHPNDLLDVKTQLDFDELYIEYFKREPLY